MDFVDKGLDFYLGPKIADKIRSQARFKTAIFFHFSFHASLELAQNILDELHVSAFRLLFSCSSSQGAKSISNWSELVS